jgi:glutamate synthase domain-containing protein 1/uncharacterized protein YaaR (DUF327 family)
LYDPGNEHDACGVGFVVNMHGEKSHRIVRNGLEILVNLTHRGACGCDPLTGDGAGILTQMPDEFLRAKAAELGITLPPLGDYAAGLIFLPTDESQRKHCETRLEAITAEEGQKFLGWRDVPVDNRDIGRTARDVEPVIRQAFIARGENTPADMFEWKLYVLRKRLEIEILHSDLSQKSYCYIPSLSSKTIIYKGLLLADQVERFYSDRVDERFESALALVHQRYSTNTFPTWDLAHPFRYLAHNGEINTLRGNVNWMHARESMLASDKYGADLKKICPVVIPHGSDSATFDNALELLIVTGRSLEQAMSMLIPEPWAGHESMPDDLKAYYEYQACLMEPWDGPASMAFTDGTRIGACLDRNGLRPSRYWVTKDGMVVMASEAGVLEIPPQDVVRKGRLRPGRMFMIDTKEGRIIGDDEIKRGLASRHPYRKWINDNQLTLEALPEIEGVNGHLEEPLLNLQRTFGYSIEDLKIIVGPMGADGYEPIGSMGDDTPLAVLSNRPQLLYNYFKQLFAQVTNPPLDAIREEIITSMITTIGSEGNLLDETPEQARLLRLDVPVISNQELAKIKQLNVHRLKSRTLSILFPRKEGAAGMRRRLDELRREASQAIAEGITILILSDRGVNRDNVPIPALLATSAVHHHLIREETRTRCGLVVETGEAREVQHFALLTGYGAGAVNPYLAFATLEQLLKEKYLPEKYTYEKLVKNYTKAAVKGVLKVMSKMGISTQQSYRGAQIFEAVGLNHRFVDEFFTWTPTRIEGVGLEQVAEESLRMHEHAYPTTTVPSNLDLDVGGRYQWRRKGEAHMFSPDVVAKLKKEAESREAEIIKNKRPAGTLDKK